MEQGPLRRALPTTTTPPRVSPCRAATSAQVLPIDVQRLLHVLQHNELHRHVLRHDGVEVLLPGELSMEQGVPHDPVRHQRRMLRGIARHVDSPNLLSHNQVLFRSLRFHLLRAGSRFVLQRRPHLLLQRRALRNVWDLLRWGVRDGWRLRRTARAPSLSTKLVF